MSALLTQLPALIGVVVGALATILTTRLADRARWRQALLVRWDEHRLKAYMEFASSMKEVTMLAQRATAAQRPGSRSMTLDPKEALPLLAQAQANRAKVWEGLLLLGDEATVAVAREWQDAVIKLVYYAQGVASDWGQWAPTVHRTEEARDEFYRAARASLIVSGGDVAKRLDHGFAAQADVGGTISAP